jgi:(2Fe-2S) ferredoxin
MSFYKYHVFFCTNQRASNSQTPCCAGRGAQALFDFMKRRVKELNLPGIRVSQSGCLGQCSRGPVVVIYPDATWYKITSEQEAEELIQRHLDEGSVVSHLKFSA